MPEPHGERQPEAGDKRLDTHPFELVACIGLCFLCDRAATRIVRPELERIEDAGLLGGVLFDADGTGGEQVIERADSGCHVVGGYAGGGRCDLADPDAVGAEGIAEQGHDVRPSLGIDIGGVGELLVILGVEPDGVALAGLGDSHPRDRDLLAGLERGTTIEGSNCEHQIQPRAAARSSMDSSTGRSSPSPGS